MKKNIPLAILGLAILAFVLLAGCPGGTSAPEATGITATPAEGGIQVSWNPSQASDTVGYNLYRSREAGVLGEKINPVVIKDNTYLDSDVANGAVYYYTVRAISSSGAENQNTEQASATVQVNPPSALSITIDDGAKYVGSPAVTLTLSAANAAECRVSNDKETWSAWAPYSTSMSWELSAGDGHKTVYYVCKDSLGNTAYPVSASVVLDTSGPVITIKSPKEGGSYTSPFDLTGSVTDNVASTVLCTGRLDGAAFAIGHLDVGVEETMQINADSGSHTLEVTCDDGANSNTETLNFMITGQPSVEIHIENGAPYTNTQYVTIQVEAENADYCRFANENGVYSGWLSFVTEKYWTLSGGDGVKTVYVQCKNADGVISETASDTIYLDTHQGDRISIEIDNGDEWTNSRDVKLGLYCYAAEQCRYRNEGDDWSAWSSYTTKKYWTLSSGEGEKTVHYNCKDYAGNDLGDAEATITYSKVEPVAPSDLSIKINGGDSHTSSHSVTLSLRATNADVCRYKNDQDTDWWTQWDDYTTSMDWELSPGDGHKTVYYECKNDYGKDSAHASIYVDSAPPGPIDDLSGFVDTSDTVHLAWSRPSGSDIHEYQIWRSNTALGSFQKVGSTQTTTYQDSSATPGYEYAWIVKALDSAGNEGPDSNTVTLFVGEEDVGGDEDEHGCIASAGYTWCESLQECIRPWETECP